MTEQQHQANREKIEATDLSLSNLLPMSLEEMEKILDNKENLKQIARGPHHVQILIYHVLRFNTKAIKNFNKSSTFLSCVILLLVIVQVVIAIYK